MNEVLIKLSNFFSANSMPLHNDLQAALSEQFIREKLDRTLGSIPQEILDLYKWKNGVDFEREPSRFFDYCYLYNLDAAIDEYIQYQHFDSSNPMKDLFTSLLPICTSGFGEYYFYCFRGNDEGHILYFSPGEFGMDLVLAFNSLTSMMSSVYECYANGIYYYSIEGRWSRKIEEERALMNRLNPDCKRWSEEDESAEIEFIEW